MYPKTLISITHGVPQFEYSRFKHPINWEVKEGEHWSIIGPNGAGKTQLINILLGRCILRSGRVEALNNQSISSIVRYVAFTNIYSYIDITQSYYQQRWNVGDVQNASIVRNLFQNVDTSTIEYLIQLLSIDLLMDKKINMLSSGELRKVLIVLGLLSAPRILILDNPYIGLDTNSRSILNEIFELLAKLDNFQIITVVSDPQDIPLITTHILPVKDKDLLPVYTKHDFFNNEIS